MKINKKTKLTMMLLLLMCISFFSLDIKKEVKAESLKSYYENIFVAGDGISSIEENIALPDYAFKGKDKTGVRITAEKGGAEFQYRYPINLRDFTKDTSLISFFAVASDDYATITSVNITLTDADDPTNKVSYYIFNAVQGTGASYARIEYLNLSRAIYIAETNTFWDSEYGTVLFGVNGFNSTISGSVRPYSVSVDYQSRGIYALDSVSNKLILDLDDPVNVGKGKEFTGFKNDRAILSVSISTAVSGDAAVIVTDVLGHSLNGTLNSSDKNSKPEIMFDIDPGYKANMPDAAVGIKYPLPKTVAFDWVHGDAELSFEVFKSNSQGLYIENKNTIIKDSGAFLLPDSDGKYQIKYKAENEFGVITEEILYFNVYKNFPSFVMSFKTEPTVPEILAYYYIPEITVSGGSGKTEITEEVSINGKSIKLPSSRLVYIESSGLINIKITAKGYCGEPAVRIFSIQIPHSTVLKIESIPKVFETGMTVTLPDYISYNSLTGEAINAIITFNGQAVNLDRKVIITHSDGNAEVTYKAVSSSGTVEKTFSIPVRDLRESESVNEFINIDSGDVVLLDSKQGIVVKASTDAEVNLPYPLVSQQPLSIKIFGSSAHYNYEYVDVVFTDYYNPINVLYLRLSKWNAESSNIQVNGSGNLIPISGSLISDTLPVDFYLDTLNKIVASGIKELAQVDFSADVVVVSFRFGNVGDGGAQITLSQIGNQLFALNTQGVWMGDRTAPLTYLHSYNDYIEKIIFGEDIKVSSAEAFDALSFNATIEVKVVAPDGTEIIPASSCEKDIIFKPEQYGLYTIQYTSRDINGNNGTTQYKKEVVDIQSPKLTIKSGVASVLKAGSSITLPDATSLDQKDGVCTVFLYLKNNATNSMQALEMGSEFVFSQSGHYKLIYMTRDGSYNYNEYCFDISLLG